MFLMLRQEIFEDIKVRSELMGKDDSAWFRMAQTKDNGKMFSVFRERSNDYDVVTFSLQKSGIAVHDRQGNVIQESTLTLTDNGECKLKLLPSGEELNLWQFRKRFLERLFFDF
jgi:hypothetical protein